MYFHAFFCLWAFAVPLAAATHFLESKSLLTCMENSNVWATNFHVVYFPNNHTILIHVRAMTTINDVRPGIQVDFIAYGINAVQRNISVCDFPEYKRLCPLTGGHIDFDADVQLGEDIENMIPSIAYTIPDLDARVKMMIYNQDTFENLACIEATLSNGKTVQTKYAAWPIAVVSGLGLITSGVVSIIGHSSTAAHIAANSMSLFIYFQSLAVTAMLGVARAPPIAFAWAQNFMWSVGIIKAGFVQKMANWYLQATGGTPTYVLSNRYMSVSVQKVKRGLEAAARAILLNKRAGIAAGTDLFLSSDSLNSTLYTTDEREAQDSQKVLILRGIQRVAYLTGIEITSLFITSIAYFMFIAFLLMAALSLFNAAIVICIRSNIMHEGKFSQFRQHWGSVIKGSLFRLVLVAFPQLVVMCLWEFTRRDSPGIMVVAFFFFATSLALMTYSAVRVFMTGRRSVREYKNPAFFLYGEELFLIKYGFVYVQYRAACYYFVTLSLLYVFAKCLFVATLQSHGKVQAIIVLIIELAYCVGVCWIRPFMDKRTNVFNITIAVINTLNAFFFAFFSFVFGGPPVVASVMGVVYFVVNAAFALFLLIFTIVTCVLALVYKNPDARYQPMKDDRVSFLPRLGYQQKDPSDGEIELMALGASAMKGHEKVKDGFVDSDSFGSDTRMRMGYRPVYGDSSTFSKTSLEEGVSPSSGLSTMVYLSNAYRNYQFSQGRGP